VAAADAALLLPVAAALAVHYAAYAVAALAAATVGAAAANVAAAEAVLANSGCSCFRNETTRCTARRISGHDESPFVSTQIRRDAAAVKHYAYYINLLNVAPPGQWSENAVPVANATPVGVLATRQCKSAEVAPGKNYFAK